MKCPHCLKEIHCNRYSKLIENDIKGSWYASYQICPACEQVMIDLQLRNGDDITEQFSVYPKTGKRPPLPPEVPGEFAKDYLEASIIFDDSPKASAALSRRCLQHLIREKAGIKKKDLFQEIEELINSKQLPSYLADGLDAVRHIGNFAAHPIKNTNTGEIVEVELGEAEWLLDILEGLYDFYFVQPAILQKKKDALNQKLVDAGRKPMK